MDRREGRNEEEREGTEGREGRERKTRRGEQEARAGNIPGVWEDRYASWAGRMRETLEELFGGARAEKSLGG